MINSNAMPRDRVTVDVWSDVMCPFCYIGDTILQEAIDAFDHDVQVRYHSFQLMPDLHAGDVTSMVEVLEKHHGLSRAQVEAMHQQVTDRAADVGLEFRMDRSVPANTRTAHRLIHYASEHRRQHEMVQRLFAAHFTEGRDVGDAQVLVALAAEVGLDVEQARSAIESDAHDDAVSADVAMAQKIGVNGVPFFVFDGAYALSGAQPVEAFRQALETAWDAKARASA